MEIKYSISINEDDKFSKVAKMVKEHGAAIIIENDTPKYIMFEYESIENNFDEQMILAGDEEVDKATYEILEKYMTAFKRLAE